MPWPLKWCPGSALNKSYVVTPHILCSSRAPTSYVKSRLFDQVRKLDPCRANGRSNSLAVGGGGGGLAVEGSVPVEGALCELFLGGVK